MIKVPISECLNAVTGQFLEDLSNVPPKMKKLVRALILKFC